MNNISHKDDLFWKIYSKIYDSILDLIPYKQLLHEIYSSLEIQPGRKYLDAGCGTGNLTFEIKKHNVEIIGMDYSENMLNKAREKHKNIPFYFGDLNKRLEYNDDSFDGIVSNNVLAYVKDLNFTIGEFYRILKPNGKLVLATLRKGFSPLKIYLNHVSAEGFLNSFRILLPIMLVGLCNMIILQRAGRGVYHLLTYRELEEILKNYNFTDFQIKNAYANQDLLVIAKK